MDTKSLIKKMLLAFEQGSTSIQYNKIYTYDDGPNDVKQITVSFGITEYGNLKTLIESYCKSGTDTALKLKQYIDVIGKKPLAHDTDFINLLKQAGNDKAMQTCQESAYDTMYITPGYKWCDTNALKTSLSHLVICDSFLQSGSILSTVRNMFTEKTPTSGGDEKEWVHQYCTARRKWLANHSRACLHPTVKRMDLMLDLIKKDDWDLKASLYIVDDVRVNNS